GRHQGAAVAGGRSQKTPGGESVPPRQFPHPRGGERREGHLRPLPAGGGAPPGPGGGPPHGGGAARKPTPRRAPRASSGRPDVKRPIRPRRVRQPSAAIRGRSGSPRTAHGSQMSAPANSFNPACAGSG